MSIPAATRGSNLDALVSISDRVLSAWNEQDLEKTLACYTEDCVYLDPNTRGPVIGQEDLRRYLTKLFQRWRMHWSRREIFPLADGNGSAFLWHATLTPAAGGRTVEIDGIDLALLRGDKLCRNEIYFDRMALFGG
jgi:ketosteroid isomerase-like protein